MALGKKPVYHFDNYNETGVYKVPNNKIVFVEADNTLYSAEQKHSGITPATTIQSAIDQGFLVAMVGEGDLKKDGSIPMDGSYSPTYNQDIATMKFVMDNSGGGGDLQSDGSVPMRSWYNPTSSQDLATKKYVDDNSSGGGGGNLLSNGTIPMDGTYTPSQAKGIATKEYVDANSGGGGNLYSSGAVRMDSNYDPSYNQDIATKIYVDANSGGGGEASELEKIYEGGSTGWRILGRDPTSYGDIGEGAVDFSYANQDRPRGATGITSFACGYDTLSRGRSSFACGSTAYAEGNTSFATGETTRAMGENSFASGYYTVMEADNGAAFGSWNVGTNNSTLLEIGCGTDVMNKANALEVNKYGHVIAPSFDIGDYVGGQFQDDAHYLTTKEYVNYVVDQINPSTNFIKNSHGAGTNCQAGVTYSPHTGHVSEKDPTGGAYLFNGNVVGSEGNAIVCIRNNNSSSSWAHALRVEAYNGMASIGRNLNSSITDDAEGWDQRVYSGGFFRKILPDNTGYNGDDSIYATVADGWHGMYTTGDVLADGFNPFTGSHICLTQDSIEIGDLVSTRDNINTDINNSIAVVENTSYANDKRILGVMQKPYDRSLEGSLTIFTAISREVKDGCRELTSEGQQIANQYSGHTSVYINALGDGQLNVCEANGDIDNGDYLTSSNVYGKAQKQNDDILHNYTVAKSLQDVNWAAEVAGVDGCFLFGGVKCKLIGCTYHCG